MAAVAAAAALADSTQDVSRKLKADGSNASAPDKKQHKSEALGTAVEAFGPPGPAVEATDKESISSEEIMVQDDEAGVVTLMKKMMQDMREMKKMMKKRDKDAAKETADVLTKVQEAAG